MAADIDIKQNSRIVYNKNGYRVERVALVSGVTGNVEDLLQNAIEDAALPNYGDAHPTITDITLRNITCVPMGGGQYRVTMSYRDDPGSETGSSNATVRVSAGTTNDEVKTDIDGDTMETSFTYAASTYYETFKAEVETPRLTFDFEYTETSLPRGVIDLYQGKINSALWNGYAVGTILCSSVNVDQQGAEYKVRMSFIYNPGTWKFIAKVSRPAASITGSTDPDLNQTTGTKEFNVYQSVDFTPLGFNLGAAGAVTGTIQDSTIESDIVTGGKTIILTLFNDTWVASGATFDAQRQNIIDGLDSAQSEATGWNTEVRDKLAVSTVVRTSDTVVTITLSAQALYNITAQEEITVTIPNTALVTNTVDLTGVQKFKVSHV